YIAFMFFGAVAMLSSCQDELDTVPNSIVVMENAINDQRSAEVALNGAYFRFANGTDFGQGPMVNWTNHETLGSALSGTMTSWYTFTVETHAVTSDDYSVESSWVNFYQIVNTANGVILGVNK